MTDVIFEILNVIFPMLLFIVPLKLYKKNSPTMQAFYLSMVMSCNCRKLYTLILLMALLMYHYVAYHIISVELEILPSSILILFLFNFRCTDKMLRFLHEKNRSVCLIAIVTAVFLFTSYLYMMAVTFGFVLLAAIFYPSTRILHIVQTAEEGRYMMKHPQTIVEHYY